MTACHRTYPTRHRPFRVCYPSTDGVDNTFVVEHAETGIDVASFHYWDAEARSRRQALKFAIALNEFVRGGGYLNLGGVLRVYRWIANRYLLSALPSSVSGAPDKVSEDAIRQGDALNLLVELNASRAAAAQQALKASQEATGTPEEHILPDLLANLMHWASRNGFDFNQALYCAEQHFAEECRL